MKAGLSQVRVKVGLSLTGKSEGWVCHLQVRVKVGFVTYR